MKKFLNVLQISLTTLFLIACTISDNRTNMQYPIIPIPPHVVYHGISSYQEISMVGFYVDNANVSTESGVASYMALLQEAGWKACSGSKCNFIGEEDITDTRFAGTYQFGEGATPPMITIGVNMMIEQGGWFTLFVKNCGAIAETENPATSSTGCLVLLPEK